MTDLEETAIEIEEQFSGDLDVSVDEIEERLRTLVEDYKVPAEEARRSVVSTYIDETDMERDDFSGGSSEKAEVADIDAGDRWVDLRVTVVDLWDPGHESIAQVGLLGDESGSIKFVVFESSDLPALVEGQSYRLGNVVTDEYQGRYSVKLNRTTEIEELDEEIEVGEDTVDVEGALVDIQSGSGLIKRCPEEDCTRVLQNGRCSEHGEAEGEFDLRIKGVLDDGREVYEVIFDQAATETLTDVTLEEAKEMAMDALDTEVVADEINRQTLGQYYRVSGPRMGRYVLANEIEPLTGPVDAEGTLIKARSM